MHQGSGHSVTVSTHTRRGATSPKCSLVAVYAKLKYRERVTVPCTGLAVQHLWDFPGRLDLSWLEIRHQWNLVPTGGQAGCSCVSWPLLAGRPSLTEHEGFVPLAGQMNARFASAHTPNPDDGLGQGQHLLPLTVDHSRATRLGLCDTRFTKTRRVAQGCTAMTCSGGFSFDSRNSEIQRVFDILSIDASRKQTRSSVQKGSKKVGKTVGTRL